MNKNVNVKNRIVEVTTELIEQYNGNIKDITARMIATKANVGLGLINYHFGSKEKLITECVQRIIRKVVKEFHMTKQYETDKERLTACATYVFNFLFEHSAISRVSILEDFQNYTGNCNSVLTQQGFSLSFMNNISNEDKSMFVFTLTAAMQVAFLGSGTIKQLLGYDFTKTEDRAAYIVKLVDFLFEGMVQIDE
ncbi:MAG: TetR/AcrR family transcriptional regulator [Lachnospiraceae bacterium]|nr:TetR/AcrR family transcriptional regulator [Lachnospiraceae bacterium]